ncbi:MAG TPA: HPF/RaiA family ribosome-associated protein [Hanamia sp.]|nr:HPF/RaiA family ribosome-associated protein [Hanamia sp.]
MKINIKALKFRAKKELKDYVIEKVSKLSRFDERIISADVTLTLDGANIPENKICDIRLVVPGNDEFVKKNAVTFEEAILSSVDVLQKVLQRKKVQALK